MNQNNWKLMWLTKEKLNKITALYGRSWQINNINYKILPIKEILHEYFFDTKFLLPTTDDWKEALIKAGIPVVAIYEDTYNGMITGRIRFYTEETIRSDSKFILFSFKGVKHNIRAMKEFLAHRYQMKLAAKKISLLSDSANTDLFQVATQPPLQQEIHPPKTSTQVTEEVILQSESTPTTSPTTESSLDMNSDINTVELQATILSLAVNTLLPSHTTTISKKTKTPNPQRPAHSDSEEDYSPSHSDSEELLENKSQSKKTTKPTPSDKTKKGKSKSKMKVTNVDPKTKTF